MSTPSVVPIYRPQEITERRELVDQLRVNPAGRWPWLQRVLFRLLRRLGASSGFEEIRRVECVRVDFDAIVAAVLTSQDDMMRVYQKRAAYIVVGGSRYHDLLGARDRSGMFVVSFPWDFQARTSLGMERHPRMFAGLKVAFVPWVDGLFVLPDLALTP
jgi:hypothetical protein